MKKTLFFQLFLYFSLSLFVYFTIYQFDLKPSNIIFNYTSFICPEKKPRRKSEGPRWASTFAISSNSMTIRLSRFRRAIRKRGSPLSIRRESQKRIRTTKRSSAARGDPKRVKARNRESSKNKKLTRTMKTMVEIFLWTLISRLKNSPRPSKEREGDHQKKRVIDFRLLKSSMQSKIVIKRKKKIGLKPLKNEREGDLQKQSNSLQRLLLLSPRSLLKPIRLNLRPKRDCSRG